MQLIDDVITRRLNAAAAAADNDKDSQHTKTIGGGGESLRRHVGLIGASASGDYLKSLKEGALLPLLIQLIIFSSSSMVVCVLWIRFGVT